MTKAVRIENADTSDHMVVVEVWQKCTDQDDLLVRTIVLRHPTQMQTEYVHGGQYLVIREVNE